MSEINQERMLATLATLLKVYIESHRRIPDLERDLEDGAVKAIRALIEKLGEWQTRAGGLTDKRSRYWSKMDNFTLALLEEIRDFGKGAADE
jgi:hypothetical protein